MKRFFASTILIAFCVFTAMAFQNCSFSAQQLGSASGANQSSIGTAATSATPPPLADPSSSIVVTKYAWAAQTPGGAWTPGASNTITLTPCPAGFYVSTAASHFATPLLVGASGSDEAVMPVGGTCTPGATSGTVILSATNVLGQAVSAHAAGWTVGPATFGLQEALNAVGELGGGTITIPAGGYSPRATIQLSNGANVIGAGIYRTTLTRTEDYGDTFVAGSSTVGTVGINLSYMSLVHTLNYQAGPPPTISNRPTKGAHVELNECNTCSVTQVQILDMPYGIQLNGGAFVTIEKCQIRGLWDYANANVQVTIAGIQLNKKPTYAYIEDTSVFGYGSAVRNIVVNGSTISSYESVGPQYGIQFNGCEVCAVHGGTLEAMGTYGVYFSPQVGMPLLQVTLDQGLYIDAARLIAIEFDNSANPNSVILGTTINGIHITGGGQGLVGISMERLGVAQVASGTVISNNLIESTVGSGITLFDGWTTSITGNIIRDYNAKNVYPSVALVCNPHCSGDSAGNSAIYITANANRYSVTGNLLGGDVVGDPYGSGAFTTNGVTVGADQSYPTPTGTVTGNTNAGCLYF